MAFTEAFISNGDIDNVSGPKCLSCLVRHSEPKAAGILILHDKEIEKPDAFHNVNVALQNWLHWRDKVI